MISQDDLRKIALLLTHLYDTTDDADIKNQAYIMGSVVVQEYEDTAPGVVFWDMIGMWTSIDTLGQEFPKTLIRDFNKEFDGVWLDSVAINREERWGSDWATCLRETIEIVTEKNKALGQRLGKVIAQLESL